MSVGLQGACLFVPVSSPSICAIFRTLMSFCSCPSWLFYMLFRAYCLTNINTVMYKHSPWLTEISLWYIWANHILNVWMCIQPSLYWTEKSVAFSSEFYHCILLSLASFFKIKWKPKPWLCLMGNELKQGRFAHSSTSVAPLPHTHTYTCLYKSCFSQNTSSTFCCCLVYTDSN